MTLDTALRFAAKHLNPGWIIRIEVERGAGWVTLIDPEGEELNVEFDDRIQDAVVDAINIANESAQE